MSLQSIVFLPDKLTCDLFSDTSFAIFGLVGMAGEAKMNDGHLPLTRLCGLIARYAGWVETPCHDLITDFLGDSFGSISCVLLVFGGFRPYNILSANAKISR